MKKHLLLSVLLFPLLMIRGQSNLQLTWQRAYGGSQSDKGYIVIKTSDGNLIWAGAYKSNDGDFTANQGNYDIFVTKPTRQGTSCGKKFSAVPMRITSMISSKTATVIFY